MLAFRSTALALIAFALVPGCRTGDDRDVRGEASSLSAFERELEELRVRMRIPGMSGAIAQDGEIVWQRGFGMADVESGTAAGAETMYHIASLTKPFAATVILQLVEEGRLDLDAPAARFGIDVERPEEVRIRNILSHTVAPPAGTEFRYDGGAFAELEKVVRSVTGRSFAAELGERVIRPLGLRRTAPNPVDTAAFRAAGLARDSIEPHMAAGYARAWGRRIWPTGLFGPHRPMEHPTSFHPSAGLVASAPDVARFASALQVGALLGDTLVAESMRPFATESGDTLPYGLGWFVQEHEGAGLVWHYGHWFTSSALIVMIPERRLTFVLAANSDGLSRWRRLGDTGDLLRSPYARLFLEHWRRERP